ncbi:hypothetical protein [Paenibacillus dendritiformis]|uniref:hypothetical protein n=1 Tax=Paenibacillus dendritiformis TaxID=130049 RepID=UPI00387E047B
MKTSIVIFAIEQKYAVDKLNELAEGLNEPIVRRTKDTIETETKIFRAKQWKLIERGTRVNELYIDGRVDVEEVITCIFPHFRPQYDKNGQLEAEWNWREHVHYF